MRDVAGSLFVLEQGKTLYQSKKGAVRKFARDQRELVTARLKWLHEI
jgi:hypothetical protein